MPVAVHVLNLPDLLGRQRINIYQRPLLIREVQGLGKDVRLYKESLSVLELKGLVHLGKARLGVQIGLYLIIQAAFELAALAGQFLRVQGKVLYAGCRCCNALELSYIVGAAKLSSAYADAAYQTSLLTSADLLHLHPDVELFRKILDKLAEVHTAIGNIIEYSLCAVSLELNIADLHFQAKVCGQYSGADHCLLLSGYCVLPALDIKRTGFAVDLFELCGLRVYAPAFHLTPHDWAFQSYNSKVMAGGSFHYNQVPHLDALARCIDIYSLACILEPHLKIVVPLLLRDAFQDIVNLKFTASGAVFYILFQSFLVHSDTAAAEAVETGGLAIVLHTYIIDLPGR